MKRQRKLRPSRAGRGAVCWMAAGLTLCIPAEKGWAGDYRWVDEPGRFVELRDGDRPVVRYVYEAMDDSSPERRERTHKPFHHVYLPDGSGFLTKGPGGKFSHHRGIFFGFSQCGIPGEGGRTETVDTWHSRKGHTEHTAFLEQAATPGGGRHRMRIEWRSDASGTFLTEDRQLIFTEGDGGLQVDFTSTLSTERERVRLDGDPQHAGFQFRASNEVAERTNGQTVYIRPETGEGTPGQTINAPRNFTEPAPPGTRNVPWKGMSVVVGGERVTVAYLDHPSNPRPADSSERDYGRFGSYFAAEVTPDRPLTVRYRLVIRPGTMSAAEIAALAAAFRAS